MTPRGLRLNNPCCIRLTAKPWPGEVWPAPDPEFKTFATMALGVRETARELLTYPAKIAGHVPPRAVSVATIVARWAPAAENNVSAYVADVARRMGVSWTERLDLHDPAVMGNLIRAMARHENGVDGIGETDLRNGVAAALPEDA